MIGKVKITVRENVCTNGWAGSCSYNGVCLCDRDAGHKGRCKCGTCGSTSKLRPAADCELP